MMDREKVINGLECCIGYGIEDTPGCEDCPYNDMGDTCERIRPLYEDALALLKAQEPVVIQFDEIDDYEVLWLEVRDVETEDGLAPWLKTASGRWFSPLLCSEARPDMILSTPREYGRICRCWTSRPTDEQREAIPWN